MGSFGERMKREREMRGVTLEEIAESTKIGTRSLRALEDEDFDLLPGGIFNKGFVRAYARYLGLDEEQAVTDFMAALEAAQQPAALGLPNLPGAEQQQEQEDKSESRIAWTPILLVIVLAALGYFGWMNREKLANLTSGVVAKNTEQQTPAPPPPPTAAPPTQQQLDQQASAAVTDPDATSTDPAVEPTAESTTSQPVETAVLVQQPVKPLVQQASQTSTDKKPTEKPADKTATERSAEKKSETKPELAGIKLEIRAVKDTWVSVTADGKLLLEGTLSASGTKRFSAREKLVFKTGNAAGVELTYNGKSMGAVGDDKQVRTITFTPAGVQQ